MVSQSGRIVGARMVLEIVFPPRGVAQCRWPSPEYMPDPDSEMIWGREAWEWMSIWCPRSLAEIGVPAGYFAGLDATMDAEEASIRSALPRPGGGGGRCRVVGGAGGWRRGRSEPSG